MAQMIDLQLDPDEKTLRDFGFIALVGLGAIAALAWFERLVFSGGWLGDTRETVAFVLLGVGALAALLSLVHPKANKWLFIALSLIAYPIGFVLSYVIMGTLFFAIITPTGLVMRVFGRDPLEKRFKADAPTYWSQCRAKRPSTSYFQQF